MNEEYLQLIWDRARLPIPLLKLTDGKPLTVKNTGDHNTQFSGPDFYNACVEFDNLEFHGAIEIHVNSSDWYKHKHHMDQSFNSVILHVVFNDDTPVIQNGSKLPTLELKSYLERNRAVNLKTNNRLNLPCENSVNQIDEIYWQSMKTKALIHKWSKKIQPVSQELDEQALYVLIASSFGMGVNKKPFEELATIVPWSHLKELTGDQRMQLILVSSGWINSDYGHGGGTNSRWHFRGTRPSNFPTKRIPQFAAFMATFDMFEIIALFECDDLVKQFQTLCDSRINSRGKLTFSSNLIDSITINGLVPFLWRLSETRLNNIYQERAMDILSQLRAEKNRVVNDWRKLRVDVKSALDSQGLLALNRYFCNRKKCLSCEVGLKILDR